MLASEIKQFPFHQVGLFIGSEYLDPQIPFGNNFSSAISDEKLWTFKLSSPSLVAQTVKCLAYNASDLGLIPGFGRDSGEGNGNPLQYSCLENPMAGGAWKAEVHRVAND